VAINAAPGVAGREIAGAEKKVVVKEIKKKAEAGPKQMAGLVKDLSRVKGKYRCVYADPPWQYNDKGCQGSAEGHYPTMSAEQLADIPYVPDLGHEEGCFLWLWTTWPMIREKTPHYVLDAWGFRWVGEIVWNKVKLPAGRWLRPITEVLVLAVSGKAKLLNDAQAGYLEVARGKHSEKPKEARALIESICIGPRIELFARETAKGWDRWGLEA